MTLSAKEKAIVMLAFHYQQPDFAILAMDEYGDEKSSALLERLRSRWKELESFPNLSHYVHGVRMRVRPSYVEIANLFQGLIQSFENLRGKPDRVRISLRKTLESLYQLKDLADQRLVEWLQDQTPAYEVYRARPLNRFPLTTLQRERLELGGFIVLQDLHGLDSLEVCSLTGMSPRELCRLDRLIAACLAVEVQQPNIGFFRDVHTMFCNIIGTPQWVTSESSLFWMNGYCALANPENCSDYRTHHRLVATISSSTSDVGWEMMLEAIRGGDEWLLARFHKTMVAITSLQAGISSSAKEHQHFEYPAIASFLGEAFLLDLPIPEHDDEF